MNDLAPGTPYWPASPYSGSMGRHPNLNEYGNVHIWDVWHGPGPYRDYLAHYPRLATEFGYHGPSAYATLARVIPAADQRWDSPLVQLHIENHNPGQQQTNIRLADDFEPPTDDYDSWYYLAQVMQARALTMFIEWFRALFPWNRAAFFWQMNDCYPVSSWSAIDGDGRPKPLLFAARRFFAPRLVTIKPRRAGPAHGPLAVYLHHDADEPWPNRCVARQLTLAGDTGAEHAADVAVPPRALRKFDLPEAMQSADTFLVATINDARGFWWPTRDKQMSYPPPAFDADLTTDGDTHRLPIHARSLLRDRCLFPDRLDPTATGVDECATLLPDDRFTFRYGQPNQ